MSEKQIDARNLDCPQPVMLVRKALLEPGVNRVLVLLSTDVAADNVSLLANNLGWEISRTFSGKEIQLMLTQKAAHTIPGEPETVDSVAQHLSAASGAVMLLGSQFLGVGDDELGRILMRAFIKTLAELTPKPAKVFFINSAVKLTTEGSDLLADLRRLEQQGMQLFSCGTCLDYYHLNDKLAVGQVTNMYNIAQALLLAGRIIRP